MLVQKKVRILNMKKVLILTMLALTLVIIATACTPAHDEPDTSAEESTAIEFSGEKTTQEPSLSPDESTTAPAEDTTELETDPPIPLPTEVSLPDAYATADLIYDCDDGSTVYSFNGKTAEDYAAACDYYAGKDFRVYSTMEQGENKATTFVGQSVMAHIYWIEFSGELSIVLSDTAADTLPPKTPAVTDGEYDCTVAQMKDTQNFIGMGYVIQLKDGSFIVYDGSYDNQLQKLVRYITNAYKGDGKPVIRAWVLTHSHNDHYPTFRTFATTEKWRNMIDVEHVIVSPLNDKHFSLNDSEEFYLSTRFWEDVTLLEGAKVVFAHTGMNFTFCNLDMEILYTPENAYKTETSVGNFNDTSIVSRLYADGYSALFTGDASTKGVNFIMNAYGDYLKSDMCQVSHHGVEGEYILSFYDTVKAPILFYPASLALYDKIEAAYSPEVHIALEKREYVKEILIHGVGQYVRSWGTTFDADQPISIPDYTPPAIRVEEDKDIPESDRLTVNKRSFTVGEAILITAIGDGYDWVGIFSTPNTISGAYRWWRLHDNEDEDYPVAPSGEPFDALTQPADRTNGTIPAGTWYITLIDKDNGAVGVASVKIIIVDDTPIADPLAPSIHVTFDGTAEDACGNAAVNTHGTALYEEGFKGQGAVVGKDYFSIPGYDPANNSFTVTVWAKVSEITGDPALFTTKAWASGSYKGFALGINDGGYIHANIGDGSNRVDRKPNLPENFLNEWVHYTFVVDRIAGEMKISINFGEFITETIPDKLINAPFAGEGALFIGQDATGDYEYGEMTAVVDDLMIFDHALTQENLAELAALYGLS